jgi:Capsule polysaccharide biosynthesis protein
MAARFHIKMHVPQRTLDSAWEQRQVYGHIGAAIAPYGGTFDYVLHTRETALAQVAADQDFHIFEMGTVQHPRALNCASAYIAPYHYLDPVGTRYLSSIGQKPFLPDQIDPMAAGAFLEKLFATYALRRKSRYDQPEKRLDVPKGAIAVFLQSESHRGVGEALYVPMRKMVKALLARDDPRAIVVKPHPLDIDFDTLGWLAQKARKDSRLQIIPANIHDILAAASLVVTINSAVGIEAMMYRLPVITCGQADFHHATEVVRAAGDFDAAIARAEGKTWHHAEFLYWFFTQNCISMQSPDLGRDVVAKIAATGYFETLGLNSADLI